MYIYIIWAYTSRNYVYETRCLTCCIQGILQSFSFCQMTCLSFSSYLILHASSLWEVMSTDEKSFNSHVLHQCSTDVRAHCPSMDSFLIQCYSNETTWPMPITHKRCLYEHVCPYPVPQSLSMALDMFFLKKSF